MTAPLTIPPEAMPVDGGYLGFNRLRPGRIHVYCPTCGMKRSNAPRQDYDPPEAVLMHLACEKCSEGCKIDGPDAYLDAQGRRIDWFEWDERRRQTDAQAAVDAVWPMKGDSQ